MQRYALFLERKGKTPPQNQFRPQKEDFSLNNVSSSCFAAAYWGKSRTFAGNFTSVIFMIYFFRTPAQSVIATQVNHELSADECKELCWLYGEAQPESENNLQGFFVGPRREMITPWSTNAVEITQNMAIEGVQRIEEYFPVDNEDAEHDPMLQRMYKGLNQDIFTVNIEPAPILHIENLEEYNEQEGSLPRRLNTCTRWRVSWVES